MSWETDVLFFLLSDLQKKLFSDKARWAHSAWDRGLRHHVALCSAWKVGNQELLPGQFICKGPFELRWFLWCTFFISCNEAVPQTHRSRSSAEMAHRFHPELTSCQAFFQSQTSRQLTPVLLEKILLECHRVVKNMIWYSFERPFSIAAIEVGTWEIFFNWEVFNDQGLDLWSFEDVNCRSDIKDLEFFERKKPCTWENLWNSDLVFPEGNRATGSKKDLLGFPWFTTSTHNISGSDENLPRFPILQFFEFMVDSACLQVGTIMLLEVSYGWTTELCGTAFTIVTRLFSGGERNRTLSGSPYVVSETSHLGNLAIPIIIMFSISILYLEFLSSPQKWSVIWNTDIPWYILPPSTRWLEPVSSSLRPGSDFQKMWWVGWWNVGGFFFLIRKVQTLWPYK